tara:strand:- start:377 stop:1270 length:894 start_codon:yes stop_codon:yes gene_type:complete
MATIILGSPKLTTKKKKKQNIFSKALDYLSAPLSQPSTFIKEGWTASAKKVKKTREDIAKGKASGLKVIGTTLATTGIVAGAVYGGGIVVASAKAGTLGALAKGTALKLIPSTLKGKIALGTASVLGTGLLIESKKARKFVKETAVNFPEKVGGLLETGGEIGKVIEGEKEFLGEDVVDALKTGGVIAGASVGAGLIIPKVVEWWKSRDKEGVAPPTLDSPPMQLLPDKEGALGIEGESPILPETTDITPPKRRYKPRTAKKTPSVRQSVRVNVIASPKSTGIKISNRKYINPCLLN